MSDQNDEYLELIRQARAAGATAVSTEFMCLESRSTPLTKERYTRMSDALGFDVYDFYRKTSRCTGYLRLTKAYKEPYMRKMQDLCAKLKMRFYVSDAHFKEMSAGSCCCGLPDTANYSKGTYTHALLLAKKNGKVHFSDIAPYMEWCSEVTLRNCRTNILEMRFAEVAAAFQNYSYRDLSRYFWNQPNMGRSPYKYFRGMLYPVSKDKNGDVVYEYRKGA
jgi:hypothetical protein